MNVATWNVNGIRAREAEFLAWAGSEAPDVICLQEIKAGSAQLSLALGTLSSYWSYWHGAGGYSGVSLHLKKETFPDPPEFSHPAFDRETRIVEARCGELAFASVYLPNGGKDFGAKLAFMKALEAYTREAQEAGKHLVISGDMNVTRSEVDVHPSQRNPRLIGQLPVERDLFERIIGNGLVDVGRALDPDNDRLFTWWPYWRSARTRNLGWRLDYVLASSALAARARTCRVFPEIGTSDHAPVIASFEYSPGRESLA
ncbi:MAG: exodeoxyribonuclease III [Polyangiaceae bacterium]